MNKGLTMQQKKRQREIVRQMYKDGVPTEHICKMTGFCEYYVNKIIGRYPKAKEKPIQWDKIETGLMNVDSERKEAAAKEIKKEK